MRTFWVSSLGSLASAKRRASKRTAPPQISFYFLVSFVFDLRNTWNQSAATSVARPREILPDLLTRSGRRLMAESMQHKLDRVRRPRVQITYDVETNGAMVKTELPFVVGVMADLSGHQSKDKLRDLKDRKFVPIDRDNFNEVIAKQMPRLALKVQNRLTDQDTKLAVELNFKNMEDFSPAQVAAQVPALKEMMDMRLRLMQLLSKMEGNDKLEKLLGDVLSNTEQAMALAKQMGIESEAPKAEEPK